MVQTTMNLTSGTPVKRCQSLGACAGKCKTVQNCESRLSADVDRLRFAATFSALPLALWALKHFKRLLFKDLTTSGRLEVSDTPRYLMPVRALKDDVDLNFPARVCHATMIRRPAQDATAKCLVA